VSGVGRTSFTNAAGTAVDAQMTPIDAGPPATASLLRFNLPNGATAGFTNLGNNGVESIQWQVSFTDGISRPHVITAWVTMGAFATDCVVTMHALVS
jgi:hypothetical protein